jgi:hypothetical protein
MISFATDVIKKKFTGICAEGYYLEILELIPKNLLTNLFTNKMGRK